MKKIFYPVYRPFLQGNARKYVIECMDSGWISSKGKFVKLFEDDFSKFQGGGYSSTVSNGTVALHLALKILGIKESDEIIVPNLTYIASVNAIKYVGATPIFVDSEISTWNINPYKIEEKITPKTKAILIVHLYGAMCNMKVIKELCEKYKLKLIEDSAEAFGSEYKGCKSGSFGDISTFSFFGNKTITTGEGGMIYSNDPLKIERASYLKSQAVSKTKEYWHDEIGYNYRMTNICAAIGLSQLEIAREIIAKKRVISNWYKEKLQDLPVSFQEQPKDSIHSFWMFSILVRDNLTRQNLRNYLSNLNIETRPIFNLTNRMKPYKTNEEFPIAKNISETGFNLPSYPELCEEDINIISSYIRKYFNKT